MRHTGAMREQEATEAAWAATWGGIWGGAKWGAATALLSGIGWYASPVYRGLTIQFKVYLMMTGVAFGGIIEADNAIRQYEARVKLQRRLAREKLIMQELNDDDD